MPDPADTTFAQVIEQHGLATRQEIDACRPILDFAQARGIRVSLADVMVQKGMVNRAVVEGIRREHLGPVAAAWESRLRSLALSAKEDARLAALVAKHRLVSLAQSEEGEAIQKHLATMDFPKFLAEILVEKGYLREEVVQAIVEYLRSISRTFASPMATDIMPIVNAEDLTFAAIVVANRLTSRATVHTALALQREIHQNSGLRLRLGEVMMEREMLTPEALEAVLEMQQYEMEKTERAVIRLPSVSEAEAATFRALVAAGGYVPAEQVTEAETIQKGLKGMGIDRTLAEVFLLRAFLDERNLHELLSTYRIKSFEEDRRRRDEERRRQLQKYRKPAGIAAGVVGGLILIAIIVAVWPEAPVKPGPGVPSPGVGGPGADIEVAAREAEARVRNYEYSDASGLLAGALARVQDARVTERHTRRVEEIGEEALAFDALLGAIQTWKGSPATLTTSDGKQCKVVGARRTALVLVGPEAGAASFEQTWTAIPAGGVAALYDHYQVIRTCPLGVALFCRDNHQFVAAARKALAVLFGRSDAVAARVPEIFSGLLGRPVSAGELMVRDGELVHASEAAANPPAPTATPGGGPGGAAGADGAGETSETRLVRIATAVARATDLAHTGRFGAAASVLQRVLAQAATDPGDPTAVRAGAYLEVAHLQGRIARSLERTPLARPGPEFEELDAAGALVGADEEGLCFRGPRGDAELSWACLTGKALEALVARTLHGLDAQGDLGLAVWYAEIGDPPRSRTAAARARAGGEEVARIQSLLDAAEPRARVREYEALLESIHTCLDRGDFVSALDRFYDLQAAVPPRIEEYASEIAWLSTVVRSTAARSLCTTAEGLEKEGKVEEAIAMLQRSLQDCGEGPFSIRTRETLTRLQTAPKAGGGETRTPTAATPSEAPASLATTGTPRKLWFGARTGAKGWWRYESPHYGILAEEDREDRMNRVAKLLEAARNRALEILPRARKDDRVLRVILFRTLARYQTYGGTEAEPARFDAVRGELVTWSAEDAVKGYEFGPLFREAWRQYLAGAADADGPAPAWLAVGIGEVFAAAKAEGGGDRLVFERRPADLVTALKDLVKRNALPPLAGLLTRPAGGASDAPEDRALLWGAGRCLLTSARPAVAKVLPAIAKALQDGRGFEAACTAALGAAGAKELEAAWQEFTRGL